MRIRVSDYVAEFLAERHITTVFTVVGGGAMHMNDSFGHNSRLHCIYNHHEQASAMAADAYFRVHGEMAAVCVTSGPGAVNALNGVVGAYQDSIPMLVFSGQTKTSLTVFNSGLQLRTLGNQEFDIVGSLRNMVKYAEMVMDAGKIRYCLEKAYRVATEGRPGPCWLDIPLDIQGAYIETETLRGYEDGEEGYAPCEIWEIDRPEVWPEAEVDQAIRQIVMRLEKAKRPVFYAGNGIRIAGCVDEFRRLAHQMGIPAVTCWDSIDVMETEDDYYAGRGGTMGDRAGNFAVQNSDLLICIGTRLNIYQVGYNVDTWARGAYVVVNDIDPEEFRKPTVRVDLGICCDAGLLIAKLREAWSRTEYGRLGERVFQAWGEQCREWKNRYPVVQPRHYEEPDAVNVYAFMDSLSKALSADVLTVVSNGSASVVGSQTYYIGKGQRFLMNCGLSSMGYGLPAAIGACVAKKSGAVICIEGDGSIMMNLQELQTVVTNRLPIKIFIINNQGYHQIRMTQRNLFQDKLIGVGPESGDLGFPNFEKLSAAFDIPYYRIGKMQNLESGLKEVLQSDGCMLCEVFCTTEQIFEPKSATKRLEDGRLVSPPLEDLAPFLPREELCGNMYIDLIEEI